MGEPPRRRRSEDASEGEGGLPLFPLLLVVIFAGLLLGGLLAHFFGRPTPKAAGTVAPPPLPAITPIVGATPRPVRSASPRQTAAPKPTPSSSPAVTPSPLRTPRRPKGLLTRKPTVAPATPRPQRSAASPVVVTAAPVSSPPPSPVPSSPASPAAQAAASSPFPNYSTPSAAAAAAIVRSYLGALARGDRATATTYLARGLPSESFMDSSARIEYVRPTSEGDRRYKVAADVMTSSGEYYITFTVEPGPGGLQITDHFAIKTQ